MNEIKVFENEEFGQVRTMIIESEVWFVGKDIAESLGYKNTRDAMSKHIDESDKADVAIHDGRQNRKMTIVNESGMYALIFSSKLEKAKRFKHWVTSEVLPSVRKHGAYLTPETLEEVIANPDTGIRLLQELKAEQMRTENLRELASKQTKLIEELTPKANYTDCVLNSKGTVCITQIAKDYGMSGKAMNSLLHKMRIQFKVGGQWTLYSKYEDKGYTESETFPVDADSDFCTMHTKWTQLGRLFIYNELKEIGILPLCEQ